MSSEREKVVVIINDQPVVIPLAEAIAEYFRLQALSTERPLRLEDESRVFAGLTLALGTITTTEGGAQPLYDALK